MNFTALSGFLPVITSSADLCVVGVGVDGSAEEEEAYCSEVLVDSGCDAGYTVCEDEEEAVGKTGADAGASVARDDGVASMSS